MSRVEILQNRRRHHQELVQRYARMLEMASSVRLLQTEDPDPANSIHNLGGGLNTRICLWGNRNEIVARGERRNVTHNFDLLCLDVLWFGSDPAR